MNFLKNKSISFRVSLLICALFIVLFSVVSIFINTGINRFIQKESLINAERLSLFFNNTLKDLMVAGDAQVVHDWLESDKNVVGHTINVYRKDGKVAFQDNDTINAVNQYIGAESFLQRASTQTELITNNMTLFQEALKKGTPTYAVTGNNGSEEEFFVYMSPIIKDDRCGACHGDEESNIRGVSEIIIPMSEIESGEFKKLHRMNLLISFLALLLGFVVLRRLIKNSLDGPITELTDAARDFGSGNFKGRIDLKLNNEFDSVISEFNNMSVKLLDLYGSLEQKVKDRTESLNELNEELLEKERIISEDLEKASVVQMAMLPDPEIEFDDLTFTSFYIPSANLSGDCYDVFDLGDNKYAFYVADVSGHGISSSLVTILINELMRQNITNYMTHAGDRKLDNLEGFSLCLKPSEFLKFINNELNKKLGMSHFATAFYGILDVEAMTFKYAGAAHPPPFVFRQSMNIVEDIESKGTVLGMFEDEEYEEDEISLEGGDKILLYTDGVFETEGKNGEYLNTDYFRKAYLERCQSMGGFKLITDLYSVIVRYSATGHFADDTAFLLVELKEKKASDDGSTSFSI